MSAIKAQTNDINCLNLKPYYDLNFDLSDYGDDVINAFHLSTSFRHNRSEFICGTLLSKSDDWDDYDEKDNLRFGWNLGYNYYLVKDPKISDTYLFVNSDLIRHYGFDQYADVHIQYPILRKTSWREIILCNSIGFGANIYFGKKKGSYFFFKLGYSVANYFSKSETTRSNTSVIEIEKSNNTSWKHMDTSFGFNFSVLNF